MQRERNEWMGCLRCVGAQRKTSDESGDIEEEFKATIFELLHMACVVKEDNMVKAWR